MSPAQSKFNPPSTLQAVRLLEEVVLTSTLARLGLATTPDDLFEPPPGDFAIY